MTAEVIGTPKNVTVEVIGEPENVTAPVIGELEESDLNIQGKYLSGSPNNEGIHASRTRQLLMVLVFVPAAGLLAFAALVRARPRAPRPCGGPLPRARSWLRLADAAEQPVVQAMDGEILELA